jgi:hypothetical protein
LILFKDDYECVYPAQEFKKKDDETYSIK